MDRPYDPPHGYSPYAFNEPSARVASDNSHLAMSTNKPSKSNKLHKPPPPLNPAGGKTRGPFKKFWYGEKVYKPTEYPSVWDQADIDAEEAFKREAVVDWRTLFSLRFWFRKEWWYWYPILIIITILVILMTIYHDKIVHWLTPATNWMKDTTGMWVIPIVVLFVLSFPPLFGAEIVCILCGIVWGMWIGFGIVAAGTFAGEIGNYYAFRYCCRARAEKYEKKNLHYACMAYVMRHGGFWICLLARLSAIPGHFTTAIFATCGMKFYIFFSATLLSLPKQGIVVYLGVLFQQKVKSNKERVISYSVLGVGLFLTLISIWYIWKKMSVARLQVWRKDHAEAVGKVLTGASYNDIHLEPLHAEELVGAPILNRQEEFQPLQAAHDQGAYSTPYDIHYENKAGMSVYQVDPMAEREQLEEDITKGWHPGGAPSVPPSVGAPSFPQAEPYGVRREPSQASAFYRPGMPQPIPSTFPTPNPRPPPAGYV